MNNWSLFLAKFPAADITHDYIGIWRFRVRIEEPDKWLDSLVAKQRTAYFPSTNFGEDGRHRMSFAASVGSDYRLAVSLAPGIVLVGDPIQMRAALTDGGWPSPDGRVDVTIQGPDGGIDSQTLFDDGVHGDDLSADGIFGGTYTNTVPRGVYRFNFHSDGTTERGEEVHRYANRSQFVGVPSDDPKEEECIPCKLLKSLIWFGIILLIIIVILLVRVSRR